jgi:hypothetical protein
MKARLATLVCVTVLILTGTTSLPAQEHPSVVVKVADAVAVRPICFASTVVGTTFFVLALPVTTLLKRNHPAVEALVIHPAKATFTRPLGNMDALAD